MTSQEEQAVLKDLVDWAGKLPAWQSDALRRIVINPQPTAADEDDAVAMAMVAAGVPGIAAPTPVPLAMTDFVTGGSPVAPDVRLVRLRDATNVNALVPHQTLSFETTGITAVYGENGAGKTGYVRILKRVCHARQSDDVIPNVFLPSSGSASAAVDCLVSGAPTTFTWAAGTPSPGALRAVHVFDARCGGVLVDSANDVVFEPEPLRALTRLGALVDRVRERLEAEKASLPRPSPALDGLKGTHAVGQLVAALSAKTDAAAIENLAQVTDSERARREELVRAKAERVAKSPELKAKLADDLAARTKKLSDPFGKAATTLGDPEVARLAEALGEMRIADEAAALASQAFADEPLDGTASSAAWKALFEAARAYSEQHAYPSKPFPRIETGDRCVLCQQPLGDEARSRLQRFDQFVQADAEQRAIRAKATVDTALERLRAVNFGAMALDAGVRNDLQSRSSPLAATLPAFRDAAVARRDALVLGLSGGAWNIPVLPETVVPALDAFVLAIEQEAAALRAPSDTSGLVHLENELIEIEARIRLADNKTTVLGELDRLRRVEAVQRAIGAATTASLSRKQSQLSEKLLTEQLRNVLTEEVQSLGLKGYSFEIQKTVVKGRTHHKLRLQKASADRHALSNILSDGEQRVVALAAFLAESRLSGSGSILLDDPVTSLDHRWVRHIARRIVELSAGRQTVIFTHDILFLLALLDRAGDQQVPLSARTIERRPAGPGHCTDSVPWEALGHKERLKPLQELADAARAEFKANSSSKEYERLHGEFFDKLRSTWERTVEEGLLNETVRRFRASVETNRLLQAVLEDEDIVRVVKAMSRASSHIPGHDHAPALGRELLEPVELDAEIKELRDFGSEINTRRSAVKSAREAKLRPPPIQKTTMGAASN